MRKRLTKTEKYYIEQNFNKKTTGELSTDINVPIDLITSHINTMNIRDDHKKSGVIVDKGSTVMTKRGSRVVDDNIRNSKMGYRDALKDDPDVRIMRKDEPVL